jgi:hypothetical protein
MLFRFDHRLFGCTMCILLLKFDLERYYVVFEFDFSVRIEMKYVGSLPYKFFRQGLVSFVNPPHDTV